MQHPDLLVGFDTSDDAAVYRLTDDLCVVQTVDFFPPIVDDAYDFGAIAAANALSDVYAMGGTPLLALNTVCFPEDLDRAILIEILRGGADVAAEAGVLIAGGHTIRDPEPKYGMAVTGTVHPDRLVTNAKARPGEALVLTKPIGTGIITTAAKARAADAATLAGAVATMCRLNRAAAEAMEAVGPVQKIVEGRMVERRRLRRRPVVANFRLAGVVRWEGHLGNHAIRPRLSGQ